MNIRETLATAMRSLELDRKDIDSEIAKYEAEIDRLTTARNLLENQINALIHAEKSLATKVSVTGHLKVAGPVKGKVGRPRRKEGEPIKPRVKSNCYATAIALSTRDNKFQVQIPSSASPSGKQLYVKGCIATFEEALAIRNEWAVRTLGAIPAHWTSNPPSPEYLLRRAQVAAVAAAAQEKLATQANEEAVIASEHATD